MDLGRTFCQARKASCELCPLKKGCAASSSGEPLKFPVEVGEKKKAQEHELTLLRAYVVKKGKLMVYEKEDAEWLSGQFEVPTFIIECSDTKLAQYPRITKKIPAKAVMLKTGITKYKIQNHLLVIEEAEFKKWKFDRKVVWKDLNHPDSNFSTTTLKGLKALALID
jgi:A/G-specific adenine glycosylase